MRAGLGVAVLLGLLAAGPSVAQQAGLADSPVVTLDQDRLFAESQFGRNVLARNEAEEQALAAENRKLEAAMEEEERSLTDLRARMAAPEFRKLADEFDVRVEEVRSAQEARFRGLARQREEGRRKFFETALPILGRLMGEMGAVAILQREAIVLSFDRIDITDAAIARLDAELGDGIAPPTPEPPTPGQPTPEPPTPEPPTPEPPTPEPPTPEPPSPDPGVNPPVPAVPEATPVPAP